MIFNWDIKNTSGNRLRKKIRWLFSD